VKTYRAIYWDSNSGEYRFVDITDGYNLRVYILDRLGINTIPQLKNLTIYDADKAPTVGKLLLVNTITNVATIRNTEIQLTRAEAIILKSLLVAQGSPVSKDKLYFDYTGIVTKLDTYTDRCIDVHVSNIRKKIEKDPRNPRIVITVRGAGYSYNPKH
jgi:two-component system response regulator RegX3